MMTQLDTAVHQLQSVEELAAGNTCLHRLCVQSKLLLTFVFIVCVVSFPTEAISALLPFFAVLFVCAALAEIRLKEIARRVWVALPFVLFTGLSNAVINRAPALTLGSLTVSHGVLSCVCLLLKALLTVSAVFLLMSVTPLRDLAAGLRRAHVPEVFVSLLLMLYRYLTVLAQEASHMNTAYHLRSGPKSSHKNVKIKHFGPLIGSLLLRSMERAQRVSDALRCRGYQRTDVPCVPMTGVQGLGTLVACLLLAVLRLLPLSVWMGTWLM